MNACVGTWGMGMGVIIGKGREVRTWGNSKDMGLMVMIGWG